MAGVRVGAHRGAAAALLMLVAFAFVCQAAARRCRAATACASTGSSRRSGAGRGSSSSGQKFSTLSVSARGSSDFLETMITTASPGPWFHTERATSGATRTTVPSETSTISSSSLNWSVPDATK